MNYFDKLVLVRTQSTFDFYQRINKPITFKKAEQKAREDVIRMHQDAVAEQNETVVDVTTGKTYKRKDLHS